MYPLLIVMGALPQNALMFVWCERSCFSNCFGWELRGFLLGWWIAKTDYQSVTPPRAPRTVTFHCHLHHPSFTSISNVFTQWHRRSRSPAPCSTKYFWSAQQLLIISTILARTFDYFQRRRVFSAVKSWLTETASRDEVDKYSSPISNIRYLPLVIAQSVAAAFIKTNKNATKMAELNVEKFYERLNKIHAHFLKHRWDNTHGRLVHVTILSDDMWL